MWNTLRFSLDRRFDEAADRLAREHPHYTKEITFLKQVVEAYLPEKEGTGLQNWHARLAHAELQATFKLRELEDARAQQAQSTELEALNRSLSSLCLMIPLMDRAFARAALLRHRGSRHPLWVTVDEVVESPSTYPRAAGRLRRLSRRDEIKDPAEQQAAEEWLLNEFPRLWRSLIHSVLVETNFTLSESFLALQRIDRESKLTFWDRVLGKRKFRPVSDEQLLRSELAVVYEVKDRELALELEEEDYTAAGQLITCGCCFGDFAFHDLVQCDEGCLFCRDCVRTVVDDKLATEAATSASAAASSSGSGNSTTGASSGGGSGAAFTIPCFSCVNTCTGSFARSQLERVLEEDKLEAVDSASQRRALARAGFILDHCNFCGALEARDSAQTSGEAAVRELLDPLRQLFLSPQTGDLVHVSLLAVNLYWFLGGISGHTWLVQVAILVVLVLLRRMLKPPSEVRTRRCRNPYCGVLRCQECYGEAHDGPCLADLSTIEATADGLRKFVEQQMATALVRTCPQCRMQFHKTEGCNKLTCVCRTSMCYICREEIQGYDHFCQHFRPMGGKCDQCSKCELFGGGSDDDALIRKAGRRAMKRFFDFHPDAVGKVAPLSRAGPYTL